MEWPTITAVATGILGTVCGVGGLVVAILSYRRAGSVTLLNLRLQLRQALNDLQLLRGGIEEHLELANESRKRVMAAQGAWTGGAGEIWKSEFAEDKAALNALLEIAPQPPDDYENLSTAELERQLAQVHRSFGELRKIREKYQRTLDQDDEWRRRREDRMNSRPPMIRQ
jgi:hypothetical protein